MRLHRFFTREKLVVGQNVTISSADTANQIKNVFRMEIGDKVIFFNGEEYDFECSILGLDKTSIQLLPEKSLPCRNIINKNIVLCASIVKKDNFEFIVEKTTELGVSSIIPVVSQRSEKKLLNIERLNKIAVEASEQSGRNSVPVIHQIKNLEKTLKELQESMNIVVFHTDIASINTGKYSTPEIPVDDVAIFIGPEGGWTEQEIGLFHDAKALFLGLGKGILRAETAAIVAVSRFCIEVD